MNVVRRLGPSIARALLLCAALPLAAAEGPQGDASAALEAIRGELVGLRFEAALAAAAEWLGRSDLEPTERAAGLVLRSEAHVALGDLAAAERDYEEILALTPAFAPDPALTPSKALERFRKVQARTVGRLILKLDPPQAGVSVDGQGVTREPDGTLVLTAGEHRLLLRHEGFDPLEIVVQVSAGAETTRDAQLVPNVRAILVRTEPDGVEVSIDGVAVGLTTRSAGRDGTPAEFLVPGVAPGEHLIELRKPCFHTERREDIVAVDLLNPGPLVYDVTRLVAARATLALRDGPAGAQVELDGQPVGRLPVEPIALCPGSHRLELRHAGRRIWATLEDIEEGETRGQSIAARPNAAVVGAAWPALVEGLREKFNEISVPSPEGFDAAAGDWSKLDLPADVDLVFAPAGPTAWFVHSPHLGLSARIETPPTALDSERPRWSRLGFGLSLADGAASGPALVVEVQSGGPAARAGIAAGDRIKSVGGVAVADALSVRRVLGVASSNSPIAVEWQSPDGALHSAALNGEPTAVLSAPASLGPLGASVRAAWAAVDADCDPQGGPLALANLALLISERGDPEKAVEAWKRVRLSGRQGLSGGTVSYFLGRQLQRLGRRAEALRALELAAGSSATGLDDEGPPIAPAARDRLREISGATAP